MLLVAEQRSRVGGVPEVIAVIAFHVHREPPQVSAFDEAAHASRHMAELFIMACRELQSLFIGECDKPLGLALVERDWLLNVDVATLFQAGPSKSEMVLRRRCDVNDVGGGITEKFAQVAEIEFDWEPVVELPVHQLRVMQATTDSAPLA